MNRRTTIYLDSLSGGTRGDQFIEMMKSYLFEEWLYRKQRGGDDTEKVGRNLQSNAINIFLKFKRVLETRISFKTNEYDCGLYVLGNIVRF